MIISVINSSTSERTDVKLESKFLNTSDLVKNLIEDYGEQVEVIPISVEADNYLFYIEYFKYFLPFIKTSDSVIDIEDGYSRLLAYLKIADFMADEWALDLISGIIATNFKSLNLTDAHNIYQDQLMYIPPLLNNMIANKLSVKGIGYLLAEYPDASWDFDGVRGLSSNSSINMDILERYINKPWNWDHLSNNYAVTAEFIDKHSDKPWNWGAHGLSTNPSITSELVNKYSQKPWHWGDGGFSSNPGITIDFIKQHPGDWSFGKYGLSSNPAFTPSMIKLARVVSGVPKLESDVDYYDDDISEHEYNVSELAPLEYVEKNLDLDDDYDLKKLLDNPSLTTDFIEKYINKPWDWNELSRHHIITLDFIKNHQDKPWIWGKWGLSSNPSITPDIVNMFKDKPWYWGKHGGFSDNPSITTEFIESNIDKEWEWGKYGLSMNPAVTVDFMEAHLDKPWYFGKFGLSLIYIKDRMFNTIEDYLNNAEPDDKRPSILIASKHSLQTLPYKYGDKIYIRGKNIQFLEKKYGHLNNRALPRRRRNRR